jgi:uncharacterized protein with ParB-like and HNH nuclease domain
MKADTESFTFLQNSGEVRIPFFQRKYVWEKRNWEDLLQDLLDSEKTHFLGSLILKEERTPVGKLKILQVIDGQQRLTTLSILLKAIYALAPPEKQKAYSSSLEKCLFYKEKAADQNAKVKIHHSQVDRNHFNCVIGTISDGIISQIEEKDISAITERDPNIMQCYKYFLDALVVVSEDDREDLFNRLLSPEYKILVVISLDDNDNEQVIFDTINSAGVRLTTTDIVKNALFQKALELLGQENTIALYNDTWFKVFESEDEPIAFWKSLKATGRFMRDNSEILLHSIAIIQGFYDPEKHTLEKIPELYKSKIANLGKNDIEPFIKEIAGYATIYLDKFSEYENTKLFSYDDILIRLLHILDNLGLSTFHPYILYLVKILDDDDAELNKRLKALESYVVKQMLSHGETKNYNKICAEFIADKDSLSNRLAALTDQSILSGIEQIGNKEATVVLFWLELYRRWSDPMHTVKSLSYSYSLEHIMPQKWEEYWGTVSCYDDNGNALSEQDAIKNTRGRKIYALGNMTILNGRLNTVLRNYIFDKKVKGEPSPGKGKRRRKGYTDYQDITLVKELVDAFGSGLTAWDERTITKRTRSLGTEILDVFK